MTSDKELIQEWLIKSKAPKDVLNAMRSIDERLQTYAIIIDDAEKALGWKGIGLAEGESIATGIEKLYAKLSSPPAEVNEAYTEYLNEAWGSGMTAMSFEDWWKQQQAERGNGA